jgi:hypothetical protein
MTHEEVAKLKPGDKVYWTDPAEDEWPEDTCSRLIVIKDIHPNDEFVGIAEKDGGYLECFPHELSRRS